MAVLRPVQHEDRLTLVEHLTELRSRLFICLAILVVAFSFTYWQNERVLDIVNKPLERSQQAPRDCAEAGDSLEKSACFDRAVAKALGALTPAIQQLSGTTSALAANESASTRASTAEQLARVETATKALTDAAKLAPRSTERRPVTLGVAEPFFQTINVALYAALVIALPLLLYQLYAFLIPAFTTRERRVVVPVMVGIPFLFYGGVAFGYFLALPRAVDFLQNFNDQAFDILVQAKDYYKFVTLFLAGTGIAFQVPVLVLAISRLGVLSVTQLRKQRGIVILIAAVVAAVITPTPDPVTMLLVMAPLVVLFELSLLVAAFLERRSPARDRWKMWDDDDEDDDGELGGGPDAPHDGDGGDDLDPWERDHADEDESRWPVDDAVSVPGDPPEPTWPGGATDAGPDDPGPIGGGAAPVGEAPDPALQGDPAGPRVVGSQEPAPWWEEADDLDARDPYAADDGDAQPADRRRD